MFETGAEHQSLYLRAGRGVLPGGVAGSVGILVEAGRIARVSLADNTDSTRAARIIDLPGTTLFPGFVDVHIHGANGVDTMEASVEDLHAAARFLARRGVTAWLPTLVPAPAEDYARVASVVEQLMRAQDEMPAAARVLGLHYEGPFVNEQQCGALRTRYFRTFSEPSNLNSLATIKEKSAAHMMTLAPEIEGGIELVRELKRRGWIVSIGHTRADAGVLDKARAAGARHMTHFLNAMSPLHHRAPGPIGWGLVQDDVSVDIIADGIHSDLLMLKLVTRCKGASHVALISDAVAPAGLGDGEYRVWGETIKVEGGRTSNERGSIAGSVITMLDAVRNVSALGIGEWEAACMASLNPAGLVGADKECGSIEEGKRADLVALDAEGQVRLTLVGGRVAFEEKG